MRARVLIAGATGVVGRALVPMLRARGHHVTALAQRTSLAAATGTGTDGVVVADALNASAVCSAVHYARPDVVMYQLSALCASAVEGLEGTARLRTQGTSNLVTAAKAAKVGKIVAASIAFATAPVGGPVLTEDAGLYLEAPDPSWALSVRAVAEHERLVLRTAGLSGIVLRYGTLYGPGTHYHRSGPIGGMVARGKLPLPESAAGVTSFLHVEDAARAAVAAVEADIDGVFNVTDNEPAAAGDWVPEYARLLGAPAPRAVPAKLVEPLLGWFTGYQLTTMRGGANDRARRALGWKPLVPSWRAGMAA